MATDLQKGKAAARERDDLTRSDLPAPKTQPGGRGARKPPRKGRAPGESGRVITYLREVVAELRKVIYPSRNELLTYVVVVLVFVIFMIALTAGLDFLTSKVVVAVFT